MTKPLITLPCTAQELENALHAVCLRTIDVIEGRQSLGKPQPISGNDAEK